MRNSNRLTRREWIIAIGYFFVSQLDDYFERLHTNYRNPNLNRYIINRYPEIDNKAPLREEELRRIINDFFEEQRAELKRESH
jgi:hypothetical protein